MAEKVLYLEGLRGLAAFTVFLGHFFPLYIRIPALLTFAYIGRNFSICVFFVLSGFVLTYSFFRTGRHETLVSGAVRRYIRLLVPILFVLVLVYVLIYPGPEDLFDIHAFTMMISQAFWGVFLQGQSAYLPNVEDYTGVLWTITIEFIGSFLVFSFAALFGQLRNRGVFYLAAMALFLNTYFFAFILGMILADGYTNKFFTRFRFSTPWILLPIGVIVAASAAYPVALFGQLLNHGMAELAAIFTTTGPFAATTLFQIGGNVPVEDFFHIIGAAALLFLILNYERMQSVLSTTVPVFLGKISFSLYLIHMVVILTFSVFMMSIFFNNPADPANGTIVLVFTIPILFLLSYLMYRYIDKPGTVLAKKIYARYFFRENNS
jgi:peptidoglycan/LPS O-acetylase OafA/YrhL